MNILIDLQGNFLFGGEFTVHENGISFPNGMLNADYNLSNTTIIDAELPDPFIAPAWQWKNGVWVCVDQALIDAYYAEQKALRNAAMTEARAEAYRIESDPLYFKSQRGEATLDEWKAKVAEIRSRYPVEP